MTSINGGTLSGYFVGVRLMIDVAPYQAVNAASAMAMGLVSVDEVDRLRARLDEASKQ